MGRRIFDAHCDTVYELQQKNCGLLCNKLHLDLERMESYERYIQVFAAFVDRTEICCSPMNHCIALLERMHREIEKSGGRVALIRTAEELEKTEKEGKCGAILSLEGGEALEGNLSALWMYYQLGVRLITLTWNHANEIADGITESRGGGLTAFGREAVKAMEEMGILIDVSHLSVRGFWDVAECTRFPFLASHSCVKALCGHPRNLDDEQLRLLIDRKGVMGMNFYPLFLTENSSCDISDVLRHMEYVLEMGGEKCLALGSDFDGVESLPEGLSGVQDMERLCRAMEERGFTEKQMDAICFGNLRRIFHETLSRSL